MAAVQLKKIDSLQIFRGLAALGVVFHHTAISQALLLVTSRIV
jgi:peptidoglycan/LPS O-acetylase OafA/YrhL